jgi:hypothetical protein
LNDIVDFPRVLQVIKDAQGIAVDDLVIRHEKRATSTKVKNARPECFTGVMECHQDLQPAIEKLVNGKIDTRPIFQRSVALCSQLTRTCIGCQSFFQIDVNAFDMPATPAVSTSLQAMETADPVPDSTDAVASPCTSMFQYLIHFSCS